MGTPYHWGLRFQRTLVKYISLMQSTSSDGERLSKRVMQLRACSRREAEQYIEGGWVMLDGVVVEEPQHRVSTQQVSIDKDASLLNLTSVTLILCKPADWLDGREDTKPSAHKAQKSAPKNALSLLNPAHHSAHDHSGVRLLKPHFRGLQFSVPLEQGASGLVVYTQDWRTQRKLMEDMATMEHELMVDVTGEVTSDQLRPIERALKDERHRLPQAKLSLSSSSPERSKLRLAVKGSHLGLASYLCELAGLEMLALRRLRLGRVNLGELEPGSWRYMASNERF
jgi:23S rRNA pseudouridine2604 synthase